MSEVRNPDPGSRILGSGSEGTDDLYMQFIHMVTCSTEQNNAIKKGNRETKRDLYAENSKLRIQNGALSNTQHKFSMALFNKFFPRGTLKGMLQVSH